MKEYIVILFLLMVCTLSCVRRDEKDPYEESSYIRVGDEIPEFTVSNDSVTWSKSDLEGKKTLLVLFSSTCGDCQLVLPLVETAWKVLKNEPDVVVLLISREETEEAVSEYWSREGFTMPYYLDPDRAIFSKFAKAYTPRIYLIDPRQRVVELYVESLGMSGEELYRKVKAL